MSDVNPYAPPRADAVRAPVEAGRAVDGYVPLARRTTAATVALGLDVGVELLVRVTGASTDAVMFESLVSLASAVFVLMWIHRAAKNLPALGRYGMEHTPAWCVGAFFIPIASLWYPFQGMREIWKASDPAYPEGSWPAAPVSPLLAAWWGTYLSTSVASLLVGMIVGLSGGKQAPGVIVLGMGASVIRAAAAVALVALMQQIAARQATIASGATAAA